MIDLSYSKACRLLQSKQFEQIFNTVHVKVHQPSFTLLAYSATLAQSATPPVTPLVAPANTNDQSLTWIEHQGARIGFIVAKKKIKRAHERNRVKRIVRDSFRLNRHTLPSVDLICIVKAEAQLMPNALIHQHLMLAWQQLNQKMNKILPSY